MSEVAYEDLIVGGTYRVISDDTIPPFVGVLDEKGRTRRNLFDADSVVNEAQFKVDEHNGWCLYEGEFTAFANVEAN
jgi:hypothetical protein